MIQVQASKYTSISQRHVQLMRFVTFNICGINNVLSYHPWNEQRSFAHMFSVLGADVICLQETKLQPHLLTREHCLVPGYDSYWSFSNTKKGYSGVVVYVKHGISVSKAEEGITGQLVSPDSKKGFTYQELLQRQTDRDGASKSCIGSYPEGLDRSRMREVDSEGRSVVLDLGFCVLFGLYCPSTATEGEERDRYREDYFALLEERVTSLIEAGREVVVMGDLNVARELYDSAEAMQALYKEKLLTLPSLGDKENGRFVSELERLNREQCAQWRDAKVGRRVFHRLVPQYLRDSCRDQHPSRADMYTCWNVMKNYRPGNFGSRIDYVLTSAGLRVLEADILPHLEGSDHCPVYADVITKEDAELPKEGIETAPPKADSQTASEDLPDSVPKEDDPVTRQAKQPHKSRGAQPSATAPLFRPKLFHRTDKRFTQTGSVLTMFRSQTPPSPSSKGGVAKPKSLGKPQKKQAAISAFFQKPPHVVSEPSHGVTCINGAEEAKPKIDSTFKASADVQDGARTADNILSSPTEEWSQVAELAETAEKTASQWSRIMAKKPPPVCYHNLPAGLRTTRKKGPNQGKMFWVCDQTHSLQLIGDAAAPAPIPPPPQDKEQEPQPQNQKSQDDCSSRCNFFQWK